MQPNQCVRRLRSPSFPCGGAFQRAAFFVTCLALTCLTSPLFAQGGTGSIQGRVFNPAIGEFVRNAEIRVQGQERVAYSEEGGFFNFSGVPVGEQTLVVTFAGYAPATTTVSVSAGQVAVRDIEIVSRDASGGGTVALGQFVVSSQREGNAKAIMEQRRNMNISTSVASDVFGDVAEGNVGEFLKFLPGVDLEYVDAETRGPRLGGMDPQYVGVAIDGVRMASADAFASYGSMINGGAGAASRSVGFEQLSITSIESIEISRTNSADMDADAPAGTINLKSKRAFDRKGRRIDWQVSLSANSDEFKLSRTFGPGDSKHHMIRPNFMFDYSDVFFNQRLGIRLSVSESKVLYQQQYVTHTYNKTPITTGANQDHRPMVLTAIQFVDGPKFVDRFTTSLTADFKATDRLTLSLTSMFNAYNGSTYTRALTFTAASNNVNANTGRGNVLGDGLTQIQTNGLSTNTSRTLGYGGQNFAKLTNTVTVAPRFEYKLDNLTIDGAASVSHSKNDYEGVARGTARAEVVNAVVGDWQATRSDPNSPQWTITQLSGSNWSDLASFTNPRVSTEDGRFAEVTIYNAEINSRWVLPTRVPTFIKFGGKINEEYRKSQNTTVYHTYAYTGPGGGATGSWAAYPSPRPFARRFDDISPLQLNNMPVMINREALGQLFTDHPEYFTNVATAEQYYTAFYAGNRDFKQIVSAAYGMANTRIGKWQFQGGLRWEETETRSKEFDPLTPAEVIGAGFPVNATTQRATTIPGMDYQFGTRPRVTRKGVYDHFFPSVSARYAWRPNVHAQFGYSKAIARPPIDSLSGLWSINETALVVTAPNPNLKPEVSDNFVARIAYYFEPVGSFTFLIQQNEISNLQVTERISAEEAGYGDDPTYDGYEFQTPRNIDEMYRFRNFELGYNQQLSFLPGLLQGTNVNLSYTRSYANLTRPGVVPHKITAGLAWSYARVSLRAGAVWMDDAPWTTVPGRYQENNVKIDLSGNFRISNRLSFFFQGRNIFNEPQVIMEGVDGNPAVTPVLWRHGNYGTSWVFGVKGNF